MNKYCLLFGLLLSVFASCGDFSESPYGSELVGVNFSVNNLMIQTSASTRAGTKLNAGTTVRVLVYQRAGASSDLSTDTYMGENTYVAASDGSLRACVTDDNGNKISDLGTTMYLRSGTYDFYAITPAIKVATGLEGTLSVPNGVDYATSVTENMKINTLGTTQSVELTTLDRKCAKLVFNIDRGATSVNSVIVDELTLEGLSTPTTTAKVGANLPEITNKEGTVTLLNSDFKREAGDELWKATASTIVLPKSDDTFQLTLKARFNGHSLARTMTVTAPGIAFEKGKEYTYTLKLYGDEIVLSLTSSGTWGNSVSLIGNTGTPTSNCYVVSPGGSVNIPVSRANESTLAIDDATLTANGTYTQISSTTNWTASLLWETVSGLVSVTNSTGTGASGQFTIQANTPAGVSGGNAVVVIKNSSDSILWSWHIWVTDYNPDAGTTHTINNGFHDYVLMDRNLGATSVEPGNIGTVGLLYQWGRKDPMPNSSDWTNTEPTLFGAITGVQFTKTPGLTQSIRHPITFINVADWLGTGNRYLWNTQNGRKTVYDPCPLGWRVPVASFDDDELPYLPWSYLLIFDFAFVYSDAPYNYGGIYESHGYSFTRNGAGIGFYPSTGSRVGGKGLYGVGSGGSYWSASLNVTGYGYYYTFTNGGGGVGTVYRRTGCAVRCVKE